MNVIQLDEESIYHVARRIDDPEARDAYLGQVCGDDTALRDRLDALLRVCEQEASFLESPAVGPPATVAVAGAAHPPERPGAAVGPYKLLEPIGEGGMGTVYMAEQTHPVRRKVALKLIKPGMDTRQVIARFEAERQALALMDHPNIARVLDAGTTESGRPYFVMELVRGIPITDYCDREQLTIAERLELFVLVCRAVQHAHQKGVIHRDIKPSNVLVTLHDGVPVPKVIDFGVAKAAGQSLTERTLYTGFMQMVGTPLYMSPEQAEMSGLDVDTRSDVYSLGVLLYELLTGTTPFDAETFRKAALDEVRRIVREQEPPKPSTRLSTLGESLSTVSANRKAEPRQLSRDLRGELDWMVMKALEKDRKRRYETANDFAADVMRCLTDRPVEACPPSARYRFSKYARRYRVALTTVTLVGLALVAGTDVSVWQAGLARKAQRRAITEAAAARRAQRQASADASAARRAQLRAETAEARAANEAAIARAVNDFLQGDLLGQAHAVPDSPREFEVDPHMSMREALDRAAARIGQRFRDQPLVEAAIRTSIGDAYRNLYIFPSAVPQLERAVELRRALLGPVHPDTLSTMDSLAHACQWASRHQESIALRHRILEHRIAKFGPDSPEALGCTNQLAEAYAFGGELETAGRLIVQVLEKQTALLGQTHPDTLNTMAGLAFHYRDTGQFDEGVALYEKVFALREAAFGPGQYYKNQLIGFAEVCQCSGRLDQAERLLREALEYELKEKDSFLHRNTVANILGFSSANLLFQKKYKESEATARQVVAMKQISLAKGPYWVGVLGAALLGQGKYSEAEPYLLRGYEETRANLALHPVMKRRLAELGGWIVRLYEETGQPEKAHAWRETVSLIR